MGAGTPILQCFTTLGMLVLFTICMGTVKVQTGRISWWVLRLYIMKACRAASRHDGLRHDELELRIQGLSFKVWSSRQAGRQAGRQAAWK